VVTAVIAAIVITLCVALVIAVARDPGPPPSEVALAYELAWDRLDFDAIWSLAGPELRDGRLRRDFIADKRAAYAERAELRGLARDVSLEEVVAGKDVAVARTRVELRDRSVVHNELHLVHGDGRWRVVSYELRTSPDAAPPG
jgi:hypothetical protein